MPEFTRIMNKYSPEPHSHPDVVLTKDRFLEKRTQYPCFGKKSTPTLTSLVHESLGLALWSSRNADGKPFSRKRAERL
ncbi:hypothetical protein [Pseudomonas protegens]